MLSARARAVASARSLSSRCCSAIRALSAFGPRVGVVVGAGAGGGFLWHALRVATDSVAIVITAIREVRIMSGLRGGTGRDCFVREGGTYKVLGLLLSAE